MAEVVYSPRALHDLERLEDFLLEADLAAARQIIPLITSAIEILRQHPKIGRPRAVILRELVISHGKSGYVALYRYRESEDVVRVLAFRHQREVGGG